MHFILKVFLEDRAFRRTLDFDVHNDQGVSPFRYLFEAEKGADPLRQKEYTVMFQTLSIILPWSQVFQQDKAGDSILHTLARKGDTEQILQLAVHTLARRGGTEQILQLAVENNR